MPQIAVIYNEPTLPVDHPDADSEYDILYTTDIVCKTLIEAGLIVNRIGITNDPMRLLQSLQQSKPDAVFNLYEGLAEWGNTEAYVCGLIEMLRLSCTGSPTQPLMLCRSKPLTKQLLQGAGLPTAKFFALEGDEELTSCPLPWPVIVKPGREDASVGIDQKSVCINLEELKARVAYLRAAYGPSVLIEQFIRGREFNVAVLAYDGKPHTLPFSEIFFVPPETKPDLWPIVSFDAKWRPGTVDFVATPVKNPAEVSPELESVVSDLACRAFELVGCRDYARVDFRVDESGQPFILEVNPNPCISPLAGLAAALESAKIPYCEFLLNLVRAALRRGPRPELANQIVRNLVSTQKLTPQKALPTARQVTPVTQPTFTKKLATSQHLLAVLALLDSVPAFAGRSAKRWQSYIVYLHQDPLFRGRNIFLAYDEAELVGFLVLMPATEWHEQSELECFYVRPASRRFGVASMLLLEAESHMSTPTKGQLIAHLTSGPSDAAARQFLAKHGFCKVSEWPGYDPEGYTRLTFMKSYSGNREMVSTSSAN